MKIEIELISQWLLIFVPLAISPGPANILFAASGATFGFRDSIPFWLGTNMICVLQSLLIGSGLGYFISAYSGAAEIIKYVGVVFLVFLSIKFIRASAEKERNIKKLTLKDGVIIELLNAKYLVIPTIMFSQFYSSDYEYWTQLVTLTSALAVLTMVSNMVWIVGGKGLSSMLLETNNQRVQGVLFGLMLSVTALWLAVG